MDTSLRVRRRHKLWPEALKREIVAALFAPGASVSIVARQYNVNTNQVFAWRKLFGQRDCSMRELFNALRYIIRYGITWRAMPNDFPPWAAVYQQAQRWLAAGCFEMLAQDLRALLRVAAGRKAEPTVALIDSRTLRSTPESGTRAGYDGA